jgi:2-C-methyl-D-erythritol 2,4-cyclodiphosphate synthase
VATDVRVGLGFDAHPWSEGSPLFLGGGRFDEPNGLAGHSDGDVVCHALADALLGAAGLGDVGEHFPDTDPAIEGIAGLDLLARVGGLLAEAGFVTLRADLTVIAERPAIGPRREELRTNLAGALSIPPQEVSVKGTRPEGIGLTGDGIGCIAVAMVVPRGA